MEETRIIVVGSINMDVVTRTKVIPKVGETVMGESYFTVPGGKGANQSVAAAKLGATVTHIGCVGNDVFGKELLSHLSKHHIITDNVESVTHLPTGIATITLADGDNSIIVVPGANFAVTPEKIEQCEKAIADSHVLLVQLEIPLPSVEKAVALAKKHGVKVILNPAPIQALPISLLERVDYITPNEHEQHLLLSLIEGTEQQKQAIRRKCIVTRGAQGVTFFEEGEVSIPSFPVEVVDTTGAGDSFNGALAVAIGNGISLSDACQLATAAGALSITKLGAQTGMPIREDVEALLEKHQITNIRF